MYDVFAQVDPPSGTRGVANVHHSTRVELSPVRPRLQKIDDNSHYDDGRLVAQRRSDICRTTSNHIDLILTESRGFGLTSHPPRVTLSLLSSY